MVLRTSALRCCIYITYPCLLLLLLQDTTAERNFNWTFRSLLLGWCCPPIFAHITVTFCTGKKNLISVLTRDPQEHGLKHSEEGHVSQHIAERMSSRLLTGSKSSGMLYRVFFSLWKTALDSSHDSSSEYSSLSLFLKMCVKLLTIQLLFTKKTTSNRLHIDVCFTP